MPKRKGRPEKAKKDTPIEELDQEETLVHYNAVIVEELRSNMQLVLECVQANSQRLDSIETCLTALEQAVQANTQRLDSIETCLTALEQAVQANTQRLALVEQAIHVLKEDMLDMERRICSKINRIAERCDGFEARIGA